MKVSKSGKYIKRLRKTKKVSQVELSNKSGVSQSNVSKIENGSKIAAADFVKIMKALGVRVYLVKE